MYAVVKMLLRQFVTKLGDASSIKIRGLDTNIRII